MLPYQEETKKLESLLEELFVDGADPDPDEEEDIDLLKKPRPPEPFRSCCTYNYGSY